MPVPSGPGPPALCSRASSHLSAHFSVSSSGPSPLKTVSATRADSGLCGSLLPPSTPGRRLTAAPPSGHPAPQVSLLHVPCGPLFCPASPPLPAGPGQLTLSVVLPGPPPRHQVLGPCSEPTIAHSGASLVAVSPLDGVLCEVKDIQAVPPLPSSLASVGSLMHKQRARGGLCASPPSLQHAHLISVVCTP